MTLDLLLIAAVGLAVVHFGTPLAYYYYLKKWWLNKPWNIRRDPSYKPKVSIIVPTYNEVEFIWKKLNDIYAQGYPSELIEVIIADSGSKDGTLEVAKKWVEVHRDLNLKIVVETERKGKLYALLKALEYVSPDSDVVVFTDADAFWEPSSISKAVSYLADPTVSSVTASIYYIDGNVHENLYRNYYNVLRVAESKIYATPVHNGPFLAIRADFLRKYGLPDFPGSDDSSFGSYVAFLGLRAIQVDDIVVKEPERGNQFHRKVRRAQHLLLSFLKTKRYAKKFGFYRRAKQFEKIWKVEWWLHVVNPWLLFACITLLLLGAFYGSLIALTLLGLGLVLLMSKLYRTWILQQLYLLIAALRNLWTRGIVWR